MTIVVRILAYGCTADHYDEYIKIGESTAIKCLKAFCNAIVAVYVEEYMHPPNEADIARLLEEGEQRGFPGMFGSIDGMHREWKNCPVEWQGTHRRRSGKKTLILEAVASQDLWIWHAFFGMPGSHNDINILDHSSVFNGIVNGQLPLVNYVVKEHHYRMGYYLSDARKDVEQAFGVLQIKWAITQGPVRYWEKDDLRLIMKTCIILHNMIIEDERHANVGRWTPPPEDTIPIPILSQCPSVLAAHISSRQLQIRNRETNTQLMNDLMENLWNCYADEDA
ncbi:uncharacterized protein LOC132313949 [Cornus florida]|uniref:uncharacterized protein LOC132313949 n=1 Tax=Cornus florida TaxID=4283 RepID=UPI0028982F64|nr:uncharacterized protein LOC132313949 [Cornus florida]